MINIIATTQAEHIAKKITDKDVKVFLVDKNKEGKRLFPDGEVYIKLAKINRIKGRTVVLHSGAPTPNQGIMELKGVLAILNEAKIKPIEIFFTYFPYGMQDHINSLGETCMAENLVKELFEYYGVEKIYVIDAHFSDNIWIKKYPIKNISVIDEVIKKVQKNNKDIIFLAPDAGSQKRRNLFGGEKNRKNSYDVRIKTNQEFKDMVKGNPIAVVDDILETGGTMEKFYKECKKCEANDIIAIVTHGVLKRGISRIKKLYSKLYLTNTIDIPEANIDVSQDILKIIK